MNVVKVIRPIYQPVKLIRPTGQPVRLERPRAEPVRLENTGGVVIYGGANDAAQINITTDLKTYYNLKKQA